MAIAAGSGSTWWRQSLHHTISRTSAEAVSAKIRKHDRKGRAKQAQASVTVVEVFEPAAPTLLVISRFVLPEVCL
jgi:hypothetical protein